MQEFSIKFPAIGSKNFYAVMDGNKKGKYHSAKELPDFLNNNQVKTLNYDTFDGANKDAYFNFIYHSDRNMTCTNRSLCGKFSGNMGSAYENIYKETDYDLPMVVKSKAQILDSLENGGQRKINAINVTEPSGKMKTKVASIQTVLPDGTYQVVRKRGNRIISGYCCNLNDIANTAKIYDKTVRRFVRVAKENGSKMAKIV